MNTKYPKSQSPLLLRLLRLMDSFSKSDDEKDFYLDSIEGFIIYVDLDKDIDELTRLYCELDKNKDRYLLIPKLTFYEVKKIMETFVNEKVYDIDTKEKFIEIIQSKNAREQFLEFIYDHESELEKWQQFYQERSRIRIIEWLRHYNIQFVFEEDLDFPKAMLESLKVRLFDAKVPKDIAQSRQVLVNKAKVYYSNEALNPRPKRGRPPKQTVKVEAETLVSSDIYTQVPLEARRFLYLPDITSANSVTFSEKFENEEEFLLHIRGGNKGDRWNKLQSISDRYTSAKDITDKMGINVDSLEMGAIPFFGSEEEDDDDDDEPVAKKPKKKSKSKS